MIVRMSDFKSNRRQPGCRGVVRAARGPDDRLPRRLPLLSPDFADCFAMECEALKYVRDEMGLTNVKIMIPFVRTLTEAEGVIELLARHGLQRG